jgi:hypothetical protein
VVWHSRGGPTKFANLVTLCARCHGLVHDGFLGVAAGPPDGGGFAFTDRKGCPLDGRHPAGATALAVTACATAHGAPAAAAGVTPHQRELEWTHMGS